MNTKLENKRVITVIPLYKENLSVAEIFSIKNTIKILSNWNVIVISPYRLESYLHSIKNSILQSVEVMYFDDKYFDSISGYNKLLMSHSFYIQFSDYEFMLIAQTDGIIISDQLGFWCEKQYSYIGAPWFEGLGQPIEPLKLIAVGNGGVSLRRINDFIVALSRLRHIPNIFLQYNEISFVNMAKSFAHRYVYAYNFIPFFPRVNEDVFWGILVPHVMPEFKVPKPQEAALFSFEVSPRHLFKLTGNKLPFACHAWEKYDKEFWVKILNLPSDL